jgi:hypothetical protein
MKWPGRESATRIRECNAQRVLEDQARVAMAHRPVTFSSYLAVVGISLIMLAAGVASVLEASKPLPHAGSLDAISVDDSRFAALKRALPAHGVVGYLSDVDPQGAGEADYYSAEYSLAPLQVSRRPDQEIVVGNFHTLYVSVALLQQYKLHFVQNFGAGVMLLRREPQ